MAGARSDLFKWKRQAKPASPHGNSGIKSWIKNVQRASDEAAREVFGEGYHGVLDQVYVDDDALSEAQDLLDSWVKEKTLQTIDPELEFHGEKWSSLPSNHSRQGVTRHDLTISDDIAQGVGVFHDRHTENASSLLMTGPEYDEGLDDEIAVQQVIRNMLDKRVVKDDILNDLGFDNKRHMRDPRTKMELRQKQVKEKSESRRKDVERSRREKSAKKEAQHLARQQILQEEKEKQSKSKRDQMLMHKEMAKIRKAMEEEQRLNKEQKQREQCLVTEATIMVRQQIEDERKMKEREQHEEKVATNEMKRLLLNQMEENAAQDTQKNLQLYQKYFSAWYLVVVEQRIKLGKARAMADWKTKLRAWNAWRAYIWHIQSDKEAHAVAIEMKERHRKDQSALEFYRSHLLCRCFQAWQIFIQHSQQERELNKQHKDKTNKMAALLEAAASGKLWSHHGEAPNHQRMDGKRAEIVIQDVENERSSRPSTARKVDELFSQGPRKMNTSVMNSARSDELPGFHILPGKPLTNTWCKQPNKDVRSTTGNRGMSSEGNRTENTQPRAKQRTFSQADKVQDLRSKLKHQQAKSEKKTIQRSRSVDMLNVQKPTSQGVGLVNNLEVVDIGEDQADVWSDDGTERSDASSKLISREAKIKSMKLTTKPALLAMEERAKMRAERKAVIDERKRKLEDEKLAKLRLEQERKELEYMKEKQEILKKKKEERRQAHDRELEKQHRMEQLRNLNSKATEHYFKTLLIKYGMSPWKQLVAMTHQNLSSAVEHHSQSLVITCFYPWLQYTRENKARKKQAADVLYRRILMKRSWRSWRKYGQHMTRLEIVAEDYCASYLIKKYYHIWQDYITTEQILYWEKERQADEHNQWRLQKFAMTYWKKLIPMAKAEREKEKRRTEMRKRVQKWLPDFSLEHNSSP